MLEWLKNRARARNWIEEVWMVDEEMGRVSRFNESMARIWVDRCCATLLDNDYLGDERPLCPRHHARRDEAERFWAMALRDKIARDAQDVWNPDEAWRTMCVLRALAGLAPTSTSFRVVGTLPESAGGGPAIHEAAA